MRIIGIYKDNPSGLKYYEKVENWNTYKAGSVLMEISDRLHGIVGEM